MNLGCGEEYERSSWRGQDVIKVYEILKGGIKRLFKK